MLNPASAMKALLASKTYSFVRCVLKHEARKDTIVVMVPNYGIAWWVTALFINYYFWNLLQDMEIHKNQNLSTTNRINLLIHQVNISYMFALLINC